MNNELQTFARQNLKEGLSKCTEAERLTFKRMYSHNILGLDIVKVVDSMPEDKLDWAMRQVKSTLDKKGKNCA